MRLRVVPAMLLLALLQAAPAVRAQEGQGNLPLTDVVLFSSGVWF